MARCSEILLLLLICTLDLSSSDIAEEFQTKETVAYAEEGCGPNRYALFCRDSEYLTVANPNTEYVSSVKMKRLYDFLSHSKCYKYLKDFLCAALFPMCSEDPFEITFPCRDICEIVQENCHPVLQKYGEAWPEELNCTRFYNRDCMEIEPRNNYDYDYDYDYDYEEPVEEKPTVKQSEHVQKSKQPEETGAGHETNSKHGDRNRNHHSRHDQNQGEDEHVHVQEEVHVEHTQTGRSRRKMKHKSHVNQQKDMRPFWKLFKKTMDEVSRSLKSLSDAI